MRLLGVGDNVVDRYRELGTMFPGGNAVNVAVFAARLGAQAGYMGVVGDDDAGRIIQQSLAQEGVDTSLTSVVHGDNASADVSIVGTDRVFLGASKGVALFEPSEEQLAAMADYDVVHAGYAGSFLPHVAAMAERTRVSFDFGTRLGIYEAKEALPHLYLAAFSSSHRSPEDSLALVKESVARGATYALATRGADGAYLASDRWIIHQQADRVQVVDTLGAGDAFIASVLVGLLAGRDRRSLLAAASAHAAQVCLAHGAFGYGAPFQRTDTAHTEVNR